MTRIDTAATEYAATSYRGYTVEFYKNSGWMVRARNIRTGGKMDLGPFATSQEVQTAVDAQIRVEMFA